MKKNLKLLHQDFIEECTYVGKLSDVTIRGYIGAFNLFLKMNPGVAVADLSTQTVVKFFKRLEQREREVGRGGIKTGIKRSTVATYWSKLNVFMAWLEKHKKIKENPFREIKCPNVEYADKKFIQKKNLDKIFSAIAINIDWSSDLVRKRNMAIFNLFLYSGIRKGELLGLELIDFNFDKKELMVRAEISKSRINRVIPLNRRLIIVLKDYLKERKSLKYKTEYFFVSNNSDDKFTEHGLKHTVAKIVEESGVKFHVHRFRHAFAINLINKSSDIMKVKQLLGHKDIRMTAAYLRCIPSNAMRGDIEALNMDDML
jgi:integrase/recombinase XerD